MFEGKVALVTGAGKGIGKEIALELARGGAKCVINYASSATGAESVAEEIRAMGSEAMTYKCDVSDADAVQKMITDVMEQYGRIDILVNNAGITKDGLMLKMTEADFMAVLDINLKGAFNCMKHVSRIMLKQRSGHIINISSVWGNVGASCEVAYSACKGGINSLTRALGKELAPSNIQVNAIACGVIDTDMNRCFSEEERSALIEEIPAGRMGSPEEVASLAYSLATASSYLNGQILTLDGGWI